MRDYYNSEPVRVGIVEAIGAFHYEYVKGFYGTYHAKISVWAYTDLGHRVWLETIHDLPSWEKVVDKLKLVKRVNQGMVGTPISYRFSAEKGIGFINVGRRERKDRADTSYKWLRSRAEVGAQK